MNDDSNFFNDLLSQGNLFSYKIYDTRKPRLTLKHINKLRKYRALHKQELEQKLINVQRVYGPGEDNPSGF
jgi:CRISPR/Cas system endoribonuclease Cas6 (RAMP superfamily)